MLDLLRDLLYPSRCPGCDRLRRSAGPPALCGACRGLLAVCGAGCVHCALPGAGPLCGRCERHPPPFGDARAGFRYEEGGMLARLLSRWKYAGDPEAGGALVDLFSRNPIFLDLCYDVVVPVPLHPSKLARRGFNQSALLARALARDQPRSGRFAPGALVRRRRQPDQAGSSRRLRTRNVRGAFTASPRVAGLRVLLVDDVLTSGATTRACAVALARAGAVGLGLAVLARTPIEQRGS